MVELSDTFKIDCEELDKDHKHLVDMVNDITKRIESGDTENCQSQVIEFVNFAKAHFSREERLLSKVGYPDIGKHREHHQQLNEKMDHLIEFAGKVPVNEIAGESLKKELVYFVMDDVITTDMDFKAFIADKVD